MLRNPLYYLLKKKPELTTKTTTKKKSYFLLPIKINEENLFNLRQKSCILSKHHFSVYEEFSSEVAELSPIHYTAQCILADATIIIHVYFNQFGNYIKSHAFHDTLTKTAIDISDKDTQSAIDELTKPYVTDFLIPLFQELMEVQQQAKEQKDSALAQLEKESYHGTKSQTYYTLLTETISKIDEFNNLQFHAEPAVKIFLQRYLDILQKESQLKKTKTTHKSKKSLLVTEEKEPNSLLLPGETKQQPVQKLFSKNSSDSEEKKLYKALEQCAPHDLNTMLSISKKLNELEESRIVKLIQACINGNQKTIETNLNPNDIFLIPALLSTAIYFGHKKLFAYLYTHNPIKILLNTPFIKAKPLTKDNSAFSPLSIAHHRRNISFFRELLNQYHYEPDILTTEGCLLLNRLVEDPKNIAYVRALLEAKANPNFTSGDGAIISFVENDKKIQAYEEKTKLSASILSRTALHQAAIFRNIEAIKLLMEHKADSKKVNTEGFTPFGMSVYVTSQHPLSRSVIQFFLEKGHQIDEFHGTRQPSTALYYACQDGQIDAIKILLEFKANPCTEHTIQCTLQSSHEAFSIIQTPLSIAAYKGFADIVTELLKTKPMISLREIQYAIKICQTQPNRQLVKETEEILKSVLRETYAKTITKDNDLKLSTSTTQEQFDGYHIIVEDMKTLTSILSSFYSYPVSDKIKYLLKKYEIRVSTPSQADIEKLLRTMVVNASKVENWREDFETLLLNKPDININAKDRNGKTALYWAVEKEDIDYITILLANGADRTLIDQSKVSSQKILDLLSPLHNKKEDSTKHHVN